MKSKTNIFSDECFVVKKNKMLKYTGCESIIVIPEGIETIEESCFERNLHLRKIIFPNSLKVIGENAFLGCSNLSEIIFGENLIDIRAKAFMDCTMLKTFNIPSKLRLLGKNILTGTGVFGDEKNWHNGMLIINNCVFEADNNIEENCVIPDKCRVIAQYAFESCEKLESIYMPASIITQGKNAFENCKNLMHIEIYGKIDVKSSSYYDDNNDIMFKCFDKFGNCRLIIVGDVIRCQCEGKDHEFIYVALIEYTESPDGGILCGRIPNYELTYDAKVIRPEDSINIGDEFEAVFVRNPYRRGIMLSKRKVDAINGDQLYIEATNKISEMEDSNFLRGKIVDIIWGNDSYAIVIIEDNGILYPSIRVDLYNIAEYYVPDYNKLIGTEHPLMVSVSKHDEEYIFEYDGDISYAESEIKQKNSKTFWKWAKAGMLVKGRIKFFKDFGIFVDLGGADGLIHISEFKDEESLLYDLQAKFEDIDETNVVETFIKHIDKEKKRVSLGYKRCKCNKFSRGCKEIWRWCEKEKYMNQDIYTSEIIDVVGKEVVVKTDDIDVYIPIKEVLKSFPLDESLLGKRIRYKIVGIQSYEYGIMKFVGTCELNWEVGKTIGSREWKYIHDKGIHSCDWHTSKIVDVYENFAIVLADGIQVFIPIEEFREYNLTSIELIGNTVSFRIVTGEFYKYSASKYIGKLENLYITKSCDEIVKSDEINEINSKDIDEFMNDMI